ncbi:hypothetical protein LCGC14_0391910 [marine sediment metagenome]|uniref:Uncharacterized protein n=1 Tax=marine sediment metagenome TaxID=412755 RepID=A0A0F9TH54_9ZZZZ
MTKPLSKTDPKTYALCLLVMLGIASTTIIEGLRLGSWVLVVVGLVLAASFWVSWARRHKDSA